MVVVRMQARLYRWRRQLVFIAVAVTALTVTAVAQAEPWDEGLNYRSTVEQKLYEVGATYQDSGGRFEYVCVDPANWADMGSRLGFDTDRTWGFVNRLISTTHTYLSPQACKGIERVMAGKIGSKQCHSGESPVYGYVVKSRPYMKKVRRKVSEWRRVTVVKDGVRRQVRKRVTRWKTVRVKRTRHVVVRVQTGSKPIYMTCADWLRVLFGAQTAAHETVHLLGWRDEGVVECYGMQNLAYWVYKLSGDAAFAKEAALDYWAEYQATRPGTAYGHPGCYAGGPLDLSPTDGEWPMSY